MLLALLGNFEAVQYERDLLLNIRAPQTAREALAPLSAVIPAQRLADIKLVVSELVTNAVQHSGRVEGSQVRLSVTQSRGTVRVEVGEPGFSAFPQPQPGDAVSRTGPVHRDPGERPLGPDPRRWRLGRVRPSLGPPEPRRPPGLPHPEVFFLPKGRLSCAPAGYTIRRPSPPTGTRKGGAGRWCPSGLMVRRSSWPERSKCPDEALRKQLDEALMVGAFTLDMTGWSSSTPPAFERCSGQALSWTGKVRSGSPPLARWPASSRLPAWTTCGRSSYRSLISSPSQQDPTRPCHPPDRHPEAGEEPGTGPQVGSLSPSVPLSRGPRPIRGVASRPTLREIPAARWASISALGRDPERDSR